MSASPTAPPPARLPGPAGLFALYAAAFAAVLLLAVAMNAGPLWRGDPPRIEVAGAAMALGQGRGGPRGTLLVVEATAADGIAAALAPVRPFAADEYTRAAWRFRGVPPGVQFSMLWRERGSPGRVHAAPIEIDGDAGTIDLAGEAAWRGTIEAIGVAARGQLPAPIAVESVALRSNAWTATLADTVGQWLEPRRGEGSRLGFESTHLAPILLVAAGALALALGYVYARARRFDARFLAAACTLVVAGWLVLDLRWQWALAQAHATAIAANAGLAPDERNAAAEDAAIFAVARRIRDADRARGGRILVLSSNPHLATRVGWFLYPDNVFYEARPRRSVPPPDALKPGDQVVLLLARDIAWDPAGKRLVWPDGRARAAREILADGPGFALVEVE